MTGTCIYCGQMRTFSEEEFREVFPLGSVGDDENQRNRVAAYYCSCPKAEIERKRENKIEAAGAWIDNYFEKRPDAADSMKNMVETISKLVFSRITVKDGKRTYTVDLDKDSCIRIKSKFTDTNEETF